MKKAIKNVLTALIAVVAVWAIGTSSAHADVNFCAQGNPTLSVDYLVQGQELGVQVIKEGSNVRLKCNNYYGEGAGSEWTSKCTGIERLTSGCYKVCGYQKPTPPSASEPWSAQYPTINQIGFNKYNVVMDDPIAGGRQTSMVLAGEFTSPPSNSGPCGKYNPNP
ncbi:MAG: hypothetical protein F6J96_22475 [Symploca sp. SIO1C2]|nr:hypothetical protein [Symploca sp. SIO1C2]